MKMDLKAAHDVLLAEKPEGEIHETCSLCGEQEVIDPAQGGEMSTFTQEDIDRAIAEVTAPLNKQIEDLKTLQQESENAKSLADLKLQMEAAAAESDAKIKEVQAQLDAAVLEAEGQKTAHADLLSFLEDEQKKVEANAALEEVKAARLELIKTVATFPEEYLTANADRFAAMSPEDFDAAVADWKTVTATKQETPVPGQTAIVAGRTPASDESSLMREVMQMSLTGIDPRRVG
jgi:chromosome segregation ATPase